MQKIRQKNENIKLFKDKIKKRITVSILGMYWEYEFDISVSENKLTKFLLHQG